jgi:putative transposase
MRSSHSEVLVYVHFVWATKSRAPLLNAGVQPRVYAAIADSARDLGFEPLAVGGMADHVHLLVRCPGRCDLPALMNVIKGNSSHLVNHGMGPREHFAWQQGYGARSVDPKGVSKATAYITDQEEHHGTGTVYDAFEPHYREQRES